MKKKLVLVLLSLSCVPFFTVAFADDTTYQPEQSSTNQNEQYNERQKREQKSQQKIYEDKQSGYQYVIPWNENSEYYGNPPPKMPEAPPPEL